MKACIAVVLLGVLPGVLAACTPSPPADTPQARCQQREDEDPNVKALLVRAPAEEMHPPFQQELVVARRKSVFDCLAAQGLAPRGGVEPLSGAHYGAGWY